MAPDAGAGPSAGERADYPARRESVLARATERGAAALVVSNLVNVRYLTGFTGSSGALALGPGTCVLVTDGRYVDQAAGEAPGLPVVMERPPGGTPRGCDLVAAELIVAAKGGPVAVESDHVSMTRFRAMTEAVGELELLPTSGVVEAVRRRKDPVELALLGRACELIDAAFAALVDSIVPGRTERWIARHLDGLVVDLGAEGPAFDTIVAAGEHSAMPHHTPTDRPLEPGDLLKIDAGARVQGYHSDMTRTFVVGSDPTAEQLRLHRAVDRAAGVARERVRDGAEIREVDRAARDELGLFGWGEAFTHGLGHGVGLQIHEAPMLTRFATDTMNEADVLTIEPGAYLPGFGGVRIEDTLAVTAEGGVCLTTTPRELIRLA